MVTLLLIYFVILVGVIMQDTEKRSKRANAYKIAFGYKRAIKYRLKMYCKYVIVAASIMILVTVCVFVVVKI